MHLWRIYFKSDVSFIWFLGSHYTAWLIIFLTRLGKKYVMLWVS